MLRSYYASLKHLSYTCLLCGLLASSLTYADAAQEAKLSELKKAMTQLRKELEATKSTRDELLKELETTEKEAGDLSEKADKLEGQLEDSQEKLDTLQNERSQLNDKKKIQQQRVSEYINAAYRIGQQSNIRLLLNQEDPSRVARNLKYYDRFIEARSEKVTEYVSIIDRINTIEPEILDERQRIKTQVTSLNLKREQLKQAQATRNHTLKKLTSSIKNQDQQLLGMKTDRKRLEKLLNRVSNLIKDVELTGKNNNFARMKGKLPWPTKGRLTQKYGSTRVANKMKWQGWLINSSAGTPVKAIHHGRVVFSDYLRGQGLLVILDHGQGYLSLYAHNQALYKELGEWVDKGETISSVGDSGGLSDHALYFELRHKGKPINPKRWLTRA